MRRVPLVLKKRTPVAISKVGCTARVVGRGSHWARPFHRVHVVLEGRVQVSRVKQRYPDLGTHTVRDTKQ